MNQSIDYLQRVAEKHFDDPEADMVVCCGDLLALIKIARKARAVIEDKKVPSCNVLTVPLIELGEALKEAFD